MDLFMETWNDPMGQQGIIVTIALMVFYSSLFFVIGPFADLVCDGVRFFARGVVWIFKRIFKEAP